MRRKQRSLERLIPVQEISDEKLLLKDGRVAIGFRLDLAEKEQKTGAEIRAEKLALMAGLKNLPPGSTLQKLDIYYHQAFEDKGRGQGYFERKAHQHFYHRLILSHESYLFFSLGKEDQPAANPVNSFFSFGRALGKDPFSGLKERAQKVEKTGAELEGLFSRQGLEIKRLGDQELDQLYKAFFNLDFIHQPQGYERSMTMEKGAMQIGEKRALVISLTEQGAVADELMLKGGVASYFSSPLGEELCIPHIVSTSFRIEDRDKELKALDLDKKLNASLDFLSAQDHEIRSAEIEAFTAEVRINSEQLVSAHVSLLLWSEREDSLGAYADEALAAIRKMSGARGWVESYDTANLFFAAAPGNSYQGYRGLLMRAENALCYLDLSGSYKKGKEGIRLLDRYRNPLRVELYNTALNNQNALVIGPSGSGKSFTVGSFIIQRHEKGHRQIIIDNGGSYKNALTALDGKYYEYEPEHPLSFNPFLLPKNKAGKRYLSGDKLTFLISLLATLWKGGAKLSQAERSILSLLIPKFYTEAEERILKISDFYSWLEGFIDGGGEELEKMKSSFDFASFLITLQPFVRGEYKEVLNAETDIDISQFPLICFDMARVKSNLLLYPIIALLITELALDQIRAYPNQRKYIYMDEAWSMLADSMGEFVENMYRTVRKNKGSMCIITQGIAEITASAVGPAILANADTQIILNHTDSTQVEKLSHLLGFSPHERDKIHSVRVMKDFRELFIKQGDYGKVYLLEVSPHEMAVLSSKPDERNELSRLIKERAAVSHALDQFVEEKSKNFKQKS
ncbi:MAG: TraM recognition domain-containing protein [Bacteroidia bacterium]|nr:TraM recognition domain-containing protein [Bacteroidia bacterium]